MAFVERDTYRPRKIYSEGGTRLVTEARVKSMTFGSHEIRDVAVTLLPATTKTEERGLLPGHLFHSLFGDTHRGIVILDGSTRR